MIYSLRGVLIHTEPGIAVVECGGVGYQCAVSLTTQSQLPPKGSEVRLFTHMAVRDDAVELFGFADERELVCFRLLKTVNGVGARVALALLSNFTADQLALAIASGDTKTLTRAAGVGSKLAQRLVLELKDKLGSLGTGDNEGYQTIAANISDEQSALGEAVAALVALGYSQSEAASALSRCVEETTAEQMIKAGLRALSKRSY
ncbi:MAG: Holliday junction branch migration protein RuvA [Oscillospiraceae bacterium]